MMKIALIGAGNIARIIAKNATDYEVVAVYDAIEETGKSFAREFNCEFLKPEDFPEVDLVVEAASQEAVKEYGEVILSKGLNLMVMSVGIFVDLELFNKLGELAGNKKVRMILPSGAIAGLDGLKSAAIGKIEVVSLTTVKPPKGLGREIDKPEIIFKGTAAEAVQKFPKNVNVAALLSLVGIGFEKTRVKIVADPHVTKNQHEIYVSGEFGEMNVQIYNEPSPDNPKTSYLAAMSAISAIRRFGNPVTIG
jgi:aspartate dehydrogenase